MQVVLDAAGSVSRRRLDLGRLVRRACSPGGSARLVFYGLGVGRHGHCAGLACARTDIPRSVNGDLEVCSCQGLWRWRCGL